MGKKEGKRKKDREGRKEGSKEGRKTRMCGVWSCGMPDAPSSSTVERDGTSATAKSMLSTVGKEGT